jgi:integrase
MTDDPRLAKEIFAAWRTEVARQRWLGPPPPECHHSVKELIDQYLAVVTPRKAPASQKRDQIVLSRFTHNWGPRLLQELNPTLIEQYIVERTPDVSFATLSKELGILKAAFGCAIRWGWTNRTPFVGIHLNQEGNSRIRWLTRAEELLLLKACPQWLQDLVVVGLDTGLRPGNLVGLQRSWVHQEGHVLIVPKENTKTKKLTVSIPLTQRARDILYHATTSSHTPYVFMADTGRPLDRNYVHVVVHRCAQAAGLSEICLYVFRHTFITRLVQAGVSLPEVAALAGHRDIRMTMRYAHLAPQHLRNSIAVLEARRIERSESDLTSHV